MLVWIKQVRFGSRLPSRKLSGHVYKQMRQWSHLSHHVYTPGKLYKSSLCTYSIFISLVNTEAIITLTETSYWPKEWTLHKRKDFPIATLVSDFVKFKEITFTSYWEFHSLSLSRTQYLLCKQARPCEVFNKWARESFFKIQNINKHFMLTSWMKWEENTPQIFFSVLNQYSLTFWDGLFHSNLYYSISHCNRGCPLLNTASVRALKPSKLNPALC